MGMFDYLMKYQPEKITDDPMPFKCKKEKFNVTKARIEPYEGDKEEFKGKEFYRYELIPCEGVEVEVYQGTDDLGTKKYAKRSAGKRTLRKSVDLSDEEAVKKLANIMFTIGLEFKSTEELQSISDDFIKMTLLVSAYHFTGSEGNEIQMHKIVGIADEKAKDATSGVPF